MTIKLPEAGSRKARVPQYGLIRVISLAVTCILAFFMVGCFLAGLQDWAGVFCAVTLVGALLVIGNEVDAGSWRARQSRLRKSKEYDSLHLCLNGECQPWECDYGCFEL